MKGTWNSLSMAPLVRYTIVSIIDNQLARPLSGLTCGQGGVPCRSWPP
jgi:hypothetical protein